MRVVPVAGAVQTNQTERPPTPCPAGYGSPSSRVAFEGRLLFPLVETTEPLSSHALAKRSLAGWAFTKPAPRASNRNTRRARKSVFIKSTANNEGLGHLKRTLRTGGHAIE